MMRNLLIAVSALSLTSVAMAATPADPWHAKGRDLLESAINIPSVTTRPDEVKKLVAFLKAEFEKGGFGDVIVKDYEGTQSLILRWKAEGKPAKKPMLLIGHIDVVDAKPEDWSRDPFKMIEEDGYFYGRGTTDMKNGIIAITHNVILVSRHRCVGVTQNEIAVAGDTKVIAAIDLIGISRHAIVAITEDIVGIPRKTIITITHDSIGVTRPAGIAITHNISGIAKYAAITITNDQV